MRAAFLVLAMTMAVQVATAAAEATDMTIESRVAAALIVDIQRRLGTAADVTVRNVHVNVRESRSGSLAVVPSPAAVLDEPIEFVVIGAGHNGRPMQIGRGRADVSVIVPHAQAARTLARGTALETADLLDVTGNPGGVPLKRLPTARELAGATLRRNVASGEVVTLQAAVMPPAVRAGETVQGLASVGPVEVVAELTAMDNGAEGSIVRVVNRETRRELRARVVRAGVVEVIHD